MNDINLKAALCKLADEDDIAESKKFLKLFDKDEILEQLKMAAPGIRRIMVDAVEDLSELTPRGMHPELEALEEYCERTGFPFTESVAILGNSAYAGVSEARLISHLDDTLKTLTTPENTNG